MFASTHTDAHIQHTQGEKHGTVKALKALLKGSNYDDLKAKNYPLAELFGYVSDAMAVKSQAKRERKEALAALKAEEEAKAKAEADAAAAAAAEAGEVAAENEGDEEEEEN